MTIKFGILACSSIARRRFIPALRKSNNCRLHFIASRSELKAANWAKDFGSPNYGSYEDLLENNEVEVVYISTPPSEHAKWTELCLEAGKHVICEKPAFPSFSIAKSLVELAADRRLRLMEAFMYRFHPQHDYVREVILNGAIGEPLLFTSQFTYPRPQADDIRLMPDLLGGVLFDSSVYALSASRLILGEEPVELQAHLIDDDQSSVDRAVASIMRFSSGKTAMSFSGFGYYYQSKYCVTGSNGRVYSDRAYSVGPEHEVRVTVENFSELGEKKNEKTFKGIDQFLLMIEAFAKSINSPEYEFERELILQHAAFDALVSSGRANGIPWAVNKIPL